MVREKTTNDYNQSHGSPNKNLEFANRRANDSISFWLFKCKFPFSCPSVGWSVNLIKAASFTSMLRDTRNIFIKMFRFVNWPFLSGARAMELIDKLLELATSLIGFVKSWKWGNLSGV